MFEKDDETNVTNVGVKILVASVIGILLSVGMCGVGIATSDSKVSPFLFAAGIFTLAVSSMGVVVGIVWAIIEAGNSGDK